jgi:predicted nucleic acid-binding protein
VRYLLDSDAVIDCLSAFAPSIDLIESLSEPGDRLCICDVVVAEVFAGVTPEQERKAVEFLEACEFLETTRASARQAGVWRFDFARRGVSISTTDALIAGTASEYAATIVTGNLSHFPMAPLRVLELPRPNRRR